MTETNPLVASGEYVRVFVSELEKGNVNVFGQTVKRVTRCEDLFVSVFYNDGSSVLFGNLNSTLLVKANPKRAVFSV